MNDVILATLLGGFLFASFMRFELVRAAYNFRVHLVQCRGDLFGYVVQLEVLHHLLDFRQGASIAAGNGFAEGHGFADNFEIGAA